MAKKTLFEHPVFHLLLIALLGLVAYSNTFHVPFLFDDETSIIKNGAIRDLNGFLSGGGYTYNPRRFLGYLSIALNYRLGGLEVFGYHVVNLAIHTVSAWLVYGLARLTLSTPFFTGGSPGPEDAASRPTTRCLPLCAALLFICHPVETQAVTYIIQRLTSLCTLFYLLSICCYVKARLELDFSGKTTRSVILWCIVSLAAAGAAMKTKEIAFTLPFIIMLYEFLFFRLSMAKKLLFLAPFALTTLVVPASLMGSSVGIGHLISDVTTATRVETGVSRLDYLFTQFPVVVAYLRLLIFPVSQNLDYDFPVYHSLLQVPVILSLLLLLALFGVALFLLRSASREWRLVSFGMLWFFVTLSVESSFIPIADVIFEHRVYLPSVGIFLAFAALASLLARRFSERGVVALVGVVAMVLAGATYARNEAWGSALSLWSDAAVKAPEKARPHYNLAMALEEKELPKEALREAVTAAKLAPTDPKPLDLIGTIFGKYGKYDDAIAAFSEALRLDPTLSSAHVNLGDAYRLKGLIPQALEQYQQAVQLTPTDADIYDKIGTAHRMGNDMQRAAVFYQCAVSLAPGNAAYRQDLMGVQAALAGRR